MPEAPVATVIPEALGRRGHGPRDGRRPDRGRGGERTAPRAKVIDCHAHLQHRSRSNWEAEDRKLIDGGRSAGDRPALLLDPHAPPAGDGRGLPRVQRMGPRRDEALSRPGPGLLLRQPRLQGRGAGGDQAPRGGRRASSASSSITNTRVPTPIVFPVVELAIELGVPILQHAGHMHYFLEDQPRISDGGAPGGAGPPLPRGQADLRPHLRRRGLGVDDQGPAPRPDRLPRHQRERPG